MAIASARQPALDQIQLAVSRTKDVFNEERQPTETEVKYVVFWRQENGRWKWHVDIWDQNA